MVISETPLESHAVHRDRLIGHARRMLRDGDRLQACEKIWGAAAHGLKVVADRRGWPYNAHSDGRVIAEHLGELTGSRDIPRLFGYLEGLHRNFYTDSFSLQEIEKRLPDADEFLRLLEAADGSVPQDAPAPDDPQYIRRRRRGTQG